MNRIRVWPHAVLLLAGIAVLAVAAVWVWRRNEPTAAAKSLPNAARLERVQGEVGINHSLDNTANTEWIAATANAPISVGDRLYTRENARTDIAFTGRNFATVDPNTSLDILDLSEQRTQVALREGAALFDVGSLKSGQLFEVATPCGAIDLQEPGMYRVAIDENGNADATAFSGSAQVLGQAGSGAIHKGEVLSVPCQGNSAATISRVNYDQAGTYLDNYYRYRYPKKYDGRYRSYYTYLDDPYYYDPSRSYNSYNYVSDEIPGLYDLDDYGDWQYVSDCGYCWHPRVDASWAPYQSGYWDMDYPYGLTWVSSEPWGYAPYHYGRWSYVSNDWYWVPESTSVYPVYSPALVAFLPFGDSGVGWVALGPNDPYTARYYDPYWQPVYVTSPTVVERIVNINVPGAVTVVPAQAFTQVIDPRSISRVDAGTIAQVRPVIDPLTVNQLRQAAFATRRDERHVNVPQAVVQQTPVITSAMPTARPFKRDLANALQAQAVSERAKSQKLQLRDERAATGLPAQTQSLRQSPNVAAEQEREKQMANLSRQAARGDRAARQQLIELRRQQSDQRRAERVASQQAQGERVKQQLPVQQMQRAAARQQMITAQQQRQQQRRAAPAIRNAPQAQPVRSQPGPPRRTPQFQPPVQPRVIAPPPQRIERRANPEQNRRPAQAQPQPRPMTPPKVQAQPHPQPVQPRVKPAEPPKGGGPPAGKGRKKP